MLLYTFRDVAAGAVLLMFTVPLDALSQGCFGGHPVFLVPHFVHHE